MMDSAYSGAVLRTARYNSRPSVPGVNNDHTHPDPEVDLFNPVPDAPDPRGRQETQYDQEDQAGQSNYPNLAQIPVDHWFNGLPAVQSGVPYGVAQQAMQDRMIADHSVSHYVPDPIRLYNHATEGQKNEFIVGRAPREAGASIPDGPLAALQNGRNGYDAINQPNEVYVGDAANVGRYRLGVKTNIWGLYQSPTGKFGQDAMLHSYTGLYPALPVPIERPENTPPYNPNSNRTNFWGPATSWQMPRLFNLPSETAITDYSVAANEPSSEFIDHGSEFI